MVTQLRNRIADQDNGKKPQGLVFCTGCRQQIHKTAWVCPSCGQRGKKQQQWDWWSLTFFQIMVIPVICSFVLLVWVFIGAAIALGQ